MCRNLSPTQTCGVVAGSTLVLTAIILLAASFSSLTATEWGLSYSIWSYSVGKTPYSAGLYALGPGVSFIVFPSTYQNMQFSSAQSDLLYTRSSDGLPLTLGVSFQYLLVQKDLYNLYMSYKLNYHHVLMNVATNIISNVACNYTAYNFFNNKQAIAIAMFDALSVYVAQHMYMLVESVQLVLVQLPVNFENSLLATITVQQNITTQTKKMANMAVTFRTSVMAANQTAVQTVTLAIGTAKKTLAQAYANVVVIKQNVNAEILAYEAVQQAMGFSTSELMQYVWYDSMTQLQTDSEFIVGLTPTTLMQTVN